MEAVYRPGPDLFPEDAIDEIGKLGREIELLGDRYLYEVAKKEHHPERRKELLRAYLDTAPLQRMADLSEKYLAYLDKLEKPHDVKLILAQVRWSEKSKNSDENFVTVEVDGEIRGKSAALESTQGTLIKPIGAAWTLANKKYADILDIFVSVKETAWIDSSQGKVKKTVRLSSLIKGETFVLRDAKQAGSELVFKVEGFPQEPDLPVYKSL